MSPDQTGIRFRNSVQNSKELNIFSYRNFYNGGGVAIGDLNNDQLPDIYFTHNTDKNTLYLNKGDFRFEDITEKAGVGGRNSWSTGVVMVDINADGWLDIYVCNAGYRPDDDRQNELYINNKDLTFTERAAEYGLNENGYTTHAAFFDYDLDGDLDCYILNNSFIPVNTLNYSSKREVRANDWPVKDYLKGGGDKMLRNDNGKYTDITETAGIYSSLIGFGLGVTVGDVNGDDYPDLYISNDFFERDYLYINQKNGTFREEIKDWIQHLSLSSMGADMADINNDGYPDIFVTDMLPGDDYRLKTTSSFETYAVYELKQERDFYHQYMQNTLQLNNRDNTFSEIAYFSGVAASDWSWGALMFDMDNDGLRDIYVCNGIYQDVTDQDFIDFFANEIIQKMVLTGRKEELDSVLKHMPSNPIVNAVFQNQGNLKFKETAQNWGLNEPSFSNGAAYGDLDNDGDLDLVVNNLNQDCFVFRNKSETRGNHVLKVRLTGTSANPFAVGAKVTAYAGKKVHFTEVIPSRGFQSSVDYPVLITLGRDSLIDSLVVMWPDLTRSALSNPPVDTTLEIRYADGRKITSTSEQIQDIPWMTQVNSDFDTLVEDRYVDFYHEGMLVKMLSREGPAISIGDIDGDGNEDLFVGTPANQEAQIYIQDKGQLIRKESTGLERHMDFEDVCSSFFDADGDKDLDLFMGSGGNARDPGSRELQDRVYLNDGKGNFQLEPSALPNNGYNTGAVIPFDFDGDGDLDLVVGSRSVPFNYGVIPPSYVYQNDGKGKFADVTEEIAPEIRRAGMITDIALIDVDENGSEEIVFTGEWMAPAVFRVKDGRFTQMDSGLKDYSGWWNSIEVADLDNDGDQDMILGNRGENFFYQATKEAPAKLWIGDFDGNGTSENIVTRSIDGKDKPVSLKRELTEQVPGLKKQNLMHREFAKKSIQELFAADVLEKAEVRTAAWFSTSVAWNNGKGNFTVEALPAEAQFSCVCDAVCLDLNGDKALDLVLGGNDYGFTPQFSRLDGGFGTVLLNDGSGKFATQSSKQSGFFVKGQVRHLGTMSIAGQQHLLAGINGEKPMLFHINGEGQIVQ